MEMPKNRKDTQIYASITQHSSNESEESAASVTRRGSENTSEREKLLGIFPEEIWEIILDHVKEPTDFENISIASPFLQNLIQPRKVLYLFPLVWEILATKYERGNLKDSSYNHFMNDNDSITRMSGYTKFNGACDWCGGTRIVPWFKGILNMRRVCRMWSNAIDAYYQNVPLRTKFPHVLPSSRHMTHDYFAHGVPWLRRFTQHFAKTHTGVDSGERSPFIGRTIRLGLHFDEQHRRYQLPGQDYQQYLNDLPLILQTFGCHVWHCEIYCSSTVETATEFYQKLSECLNRMPNLKSLQIMFMTKFYQHQCAVSQDQASRLHSTIRDYPMRGMEHLQRLRMESFPPAPIVSETIRCSGNVSRLDWDVPRNFITANIWLPNLKQISITFLSEADFRNFFRSAVEWKLETLKLRFSQVFVDWADIIGVLNGSRWTSSLTDLTLMLPSAQQNSQRERIASENNSLRLNLTCLERLKLDIGDISSLDLILPVSETLEYLSVYPRWSEEEIPGHMDELLALAERNQAVNFVGYFERPLESNIWTIFRKLKRFDLYGCIRWMCGARKTFKWSHSRYDWWKGQKCDKV